LKDGGGKVSGGQKGGGRQISFRRTDHLSGDWSGDSSPFWKEGGGGREV